MLEKKSVGGDQNMHASKNKHKYVTVHNINEVLEASSQAWTGIIIHPQLFIKFLKSNT